MPNNTNKYSNHSKQERKKEYRKRTTNFKKTNNKATDDRKRKKSKKQHPKLMLALKICIVIFLLICVIGAGVVAGMFFGLFGDEFEIDKKDLKVGASNSVVVDKNGAIIANLSGDEKRKIITLEDMADYLPKAYVAIEDERFYKHNGVDIKRTTGAIIQTLLGRSSYGGSTITQQLVKNITKDDESHGIAGITRKIKEWAKAFQVERMISKEQILELYLNILYVGGEGNLHGVELGAEYYFNKSAKELSLAECAFLAGINSSPNYYNPYTLYSEKDTEEKRDKRIKSKILTVLGKMKELGYIEKQEDYDEAVKQAEEGLKFEKSIVSSTNVNSYHTDAVVDQVVEQVMQEKQISRQLAENYVYSSGLTIYSTVDKNIQDRIDQEYKQEKYIKSMAKPHEKDKDGNFKNEHAQSGTAIIDYKTGHVLGISGGLGEKKAQGWNRATHMKKQTGSAIKIIADVAPALEEKVITPSTVYMDEETEFNGSYKPKNDMKRYKNDAMNIREFIKLSKNIPAVKIMKELTPKKAIEYLKEMGLESVDEKKDDNLALAIGGMTTGASPLEMSAAYGTIANDGVYITPTFFTKVVDDSGKTVLEPKQEKRTVFSKQTAFLTKSIAQEPVMRGGTATYCAIPGMNVVAKTGTTDNSYDRWLCGFTPYYAAATWYGFDSSEEVIYRGTNPAGQIWSAIMKDIHKGLTNAKFERPDGIVEKTVCRESGCLASEGCRNRYTEIFAENSLPEKCQGHGYQKICTESNKIATEFCSQYCEVRNNSYGRVLPKERLNLWKSLVGHIKDAGKIEEVCDIHTKQKEEPKPEEPEEPEKPDKKPEDDSETEEKPEVKPNEKPDKKPEEKPDKDTEKEEKTDKKPSKPDKKSK